MGLTFPFQIATLTPLACVLFSLAIYRVTRMVWIEEGPFSLCEKLRTRIFASERETIWQRGIICPFCISFWVAIVLFVLPWHVVSLLGLMGGAALIFEWMSE